MVDSMRYISTRDESRTEISFSDILLPRPPRPPRPPPPRRPRRSDWGDG